MDSVDQESRQRDTGRLHADRHGRGAGVLIRHMLSVDTCMIIINIIISSITSIIIVIHIVCSVYSISCFH